MQSLALQNTELKSMVDEIWASLFAPAPTEAENTHVAGELMTGYVEISGGWHGRVIVETTDDGAIAIAATMFAADPHTLGSEDLVDAVGELANIVGGSVKSCVDGHSTLSLPAVVRAESVPTIDPHVMQVSSVWQDHPLRVRIQPSEVGAASKVAGLSA